MLAAEVALVLDLVLKLKLGIRTAAGILVDRRQVAVLVVIELRIAAALGIDPVELSVAVRIIHRCVRVQRAVVVAVRVICHRRDTRNVAVLVILVARGNRPRSSHRVALAVQRKGRHAILVVSVRIHDRPRIGRAGIGVGHHVAVLINIRARALAVTRMGRLVDQVSVRVVGKRRGARRIAHVGIAVDARDVTVGVVRKRVDVLVTARQIFLNLRNAMRLIVLDAVAYAATLLDGRCEARDVTVLVTLDLVDIAVLVRFIGAFIGHRQPQLVELRVLNAANLRILRQCQRGELLFTRKIDAFELPGI